MAAIPNPTLDTGLPANIDAEKTILGAILLDNAAHSEAAEKLEADDFSLDSHRRIYIRMSELMISNDTGPMHVAAALGRPVVAIFGPTEPRRTGPYRRLRGAVQASLPCVPCMKPRCSYFKPLECLHVISPDAILARAREALGMAAA